MGRMQSVLSLSQNVLIGDGCWEWCGKKDKCGYGSASYNGVQGRTHRIMYQLWYRVSLLKTTVVMHTCDNRSCCRPAHLKLGTQADNVQDMVSKNRQFRPVGVKNGRYIHGKRQSGVCKGIGSGPGLTGGG